MQYLHAVVLDYVRDVKSIFTKLSLTFQPRMGECSFGHSIGQSLSRQRSRLYGRHCPMQFLQECPENIRQYLLRIYNRYRTDMQSI